VAQRWGELCNSQVDLARLGDERNVTALLSRQKEIQTIFNVAAAEKSEQLAVESDLASLSLMQVLSKHQSLDNENTGREQPRGRNGSKVSKMRDAAHAGIATKNPMHEL
jgi:hypothetical protein